MARWHCCWRCCQPPWLNQRLTSHSPIIASRCSLGQRSKEEGLIISIANNLLKTYDPDKIAIEVVTFGPGIDLLRPENPNRQRVESLIAQGVKFDVCLNTVDSIERETGKRPAIIPLAIPVQVGVAQILSLTENGFTLVRP